jgi:hypothetical protein
MSDHSETSGTKLDPSSKLHAALAHIRAGWHVFPIPPNSKKPHRNEQEGPIRFGVTSASNSETQVRAWWSQWPDANIAGTGFLVLDCDIKPAEDDKPAINGLDNLAVWCLEREIDLPETLEFRSQGGGVHKVYAADMAQPFGQGDVTEGVNVRAPHMGYILLPGSTIDGREYQVLARRPVASAPAEIEAASAVGK